jgi:DNA invertase Pin-like site-specific DNA recombinase
MMPAKNGKPAAQTARVVLYARVSSKEQREEGYSIEAQVRLLRDYAVKQGFVIDREFIDVESASKTGRTGFNEMLAYLRKHSACRLILVEKTDRLYRNLKDYATLDVKDWGLTIHLVKEGEILSPDSRSSQQFVHGIKVLMARNYSLNLGEETLKGMTEKARAGIYPSCAPVGYRNVDGANGKRTIVPDPDTAPVITEIFERFAEGRHSIKSLVKEFNAKGVALRGRKLYSSGIHHILRKRLYSGDFDWDGTTYRGTHEALVHRETWRRAQELLDARAANRARQVKHNFRYTGVVHCGHCGCLLVGELKKGRYVYYHCTGHRGKCMEPYTREEVLSAEFANVLKELVIPQPILEWLGAAVLDSDRTAQAARAENIKRLKARYDQIEARIETMYLDKLDGRITQEFFDKQTAAFRREQDGLQHRIQDSQNAAPAPVDQAIDMLRLTSRAGELFLQQPAIEQRRFLQTVVEKAAWKNGRCRRPCSNPSKFCATRTRKAIERKRRKQVPAANSESGSSGRIRTLPCQMLSVSC